MGCRGRYAPSPTGSIHLGNASTALLAWLAARAEGGTFVLRMEDLDRPRVVPGAAGKILADLAWMGIDWDEGPDVGGHRGPYEQSRRGDLYTTAFERLFEAGAIYPCFCSRRDIAVAASAPQAPGDEARYPGTCLRLDAADVARRLRERRPHAWRFRVSSGNVRGFSDVARGDIEPDPAGLGDFVVRRADGVPAYQLAVVVDDHAMGIEEVVRGEDLLLSTFRQLLLYDALGVPSPRFGHVPLLHGDDGARLSKRHDGVTLEQLRAGGVSAREVVGKLAFLLGLRAAPAPAAPRELVDGFYLAALRRIPGGLVVSSVFGGT